MLSAWFPNEKTSIVRMDSFSSNKGKELRQLFLDALVHGEFSPPGQHAFLGDLERWWYTLFVRALIALRQRRSTPKGQWYNALSWALDVENTLACRLSDSNSASGYERATGGNDISDLHGFYSPGRFALDKGGLPNKWMERARAGFWVGRDINFVMHKKAGSAIWWDGSLHRTVVGRFAVQDGLMLRLTAPKNRLLPSFPLYQRMTQRFRTAQHPPKYHQSQSSRQCQSLDQANPRMCQASVCRLPGQLRRVHVPHMR